MAYMTNKQRILSTLRKSRTKSGFTARQIAEKLDASTEMVYTTISLLRKEGYDVSKTTGRDGYVRYALD